MTWPTKKLGEVAEIVVGKTPARSDYLNSGFLKVVKYRDIKRSGINWGISKKGFVKESATKGLKEIRIGDVLITSAGHTSAKIGEDAAVVNVISKALKRVFFASELICYRPNQKLLSPSWLLLFLHSENGQKQIKTIIGDSVHLTGAKSRNLEILLPPLPEQKRIVARIEKLMGKIEEAKKLRQEAIEETDQIIPSALHQIFSPSTSSGQVRAEKERWKIIKLGEVVKLQGGFAFKSQKYEKTGIPIVRIQNLQNEAINLSDAPCVPTSRRNEFTDYLLEEGDLLVAMSGATTGKIAVAREEDMPALLNQRVGRFLVKDRTKISSDFLFWVVKIIQQKIFERAYGAAQPNISGKNIEEFKIPLPPLSEQKKIVQYLDSLSEKIRELKKLQLATAQDLDALTQSILHQAFEGKL